MSEELSLDFITGVLKIQLPPVIVARAGWRFDISALVQAHSLLKLEKEVRFRFTAAGSKPTKSGDITVATHGVKIDTDKMQYYHSITISQELKVEVANKGLWHELRHAWQAEAYARQTGKTVATFYEAYRKLAGEHGSSYEDNRWEIDARNFAENRHNEGLWLVVAKK